MARVGQTYYRVLPTLNEDVLSPQLLGNVKTCSVGVSTSRNPEKGAHTPSWPNGLIIITVIIVVIRLLGC
jgi:hypothetical protein